MSTAQKLAHGVNRFLVPLGARVEYLPAASWNSQFASWAKEAKALGTDPNDIGDDKWASDLLEEGLNDHYLPFVQEDSVVLELGPGSGRLSRHLIGQCNRLILADSSKPVCKWIEEYLQGKGTYEVHRIKDASIPQVASGTVDCVLAHGVVEHLDFDECYWFFTEFFRVLKPGGVVAFNYDSVLSDDAFEMLRRHGSPEVRCVFRLHHPAELERLARVAGFSRVENFASDTRISFAHLHR
jgi:ubiquinone/menaquinone biosynthesis C-methylase UbiE